MTYSGALITPEIRFEVLKHVGVFVAFENAKDQPLELCRGVDFSKKRTRNDPFLYLVVENKIGHFINFPFYLPHLGLNLDLP